MNPIRVLIIEDDFRVAEINKQFTEKISGFTVCDIASSIEVAKDMLETCKPDLVLLDVYFPDGNGIDMLWYIRKNYRDTDVMLITAAKELETVQDAIRGGVIDYIIKPVLFDRFQKTLRKYVEYRQQLTTIDHHVDQTKVDHLLNVVRNETGSEPALPKGIDPLTLEKIKENSTFFEAPGVTAEELGNEIGISRTTARRYLEFLVSTGLLSANLSYGQVGRPERLYQLHKETGH